MSNQQAIDLVTYAAILAENRELRTAGFFASAGFEAILPKVTKNEEKDFYDKRISDYCYFYKRESWVEDTLKDAKTIRNKIIHNLDYSEVNEMIRFMCRVLDLDEKKILAETDPEDFRRLRKKITSETEQPYFAGFGNLFKGFAESDFRNLHDLRYSLRLLQAKLSLFCQKISPQLVFDEISEANSAYVWLAAVDQLEGHRSKIDKPSISVLLTNQDMRIYLDFGGRCKEQRKRYYKNLLNKKYDQILRNLDENYRIFDVYWYFNLENILTIQDFVEKRDMGRLVEQKALIDEVEDFIGFVEENRTIPENKLLLGKIFTKDQVVALGEEVVSVVQHTYADLHKIYVDLI